MKKNLIRLCSVYFLTCLLTCPVYGTDEFLFSWQGETEKFEQDTEGRLFLSAERAAGTASLFTHSGKSLNTSWSFLVKMNFKPSSNNNVRVYLCADTVGLGRLWGLCLRIGADKSISLWNEPSTGNGKNLLKGIANRLDVDTVALSVRVSLDWEGTCCLYSRLNDEDDYVLEGTVVLGNIPADRFFGLYCTYSVTRHQDAFSFSGFHLTDLSALPPPGPAPEPVDIAPLDVVINELMYRPHVGGDEYVELYNRSDKPVDLSLLSVATRKDDGSLQRIKALASSACWLEANQFALISGLRERVCAYYTCCPDALSVDLGTMTALPDGGGTVVVFSHRTGRVVDEFTYSEKLHVSGLSETRGVALERIDTESATNIAGNWTSASAQTRYGSPGCPNTSSGLEPAGTTNSKDVYIVEPYQLPGLDCYRIYYTFHSDGVRGNILVFDREGRLVDQAANNILLGQNGSFDWRSPLNLSPGVYLVYMEAFEDKGFVGKYKFPVVVR